VCSTLCHVLIIYVHSTSVGMPRASNYVGVHVNQVSNDTCCESMDMTYKCIVNKVLEKPTKNIFMAARK
jgi:hypothetical protein